MYLLVRGDGRKPISSSIICQMVLCSDKTNKGHRQSHVLVRVYICVLCYLGSRAASLIK